MAVIKSLFEPEGLIGGQEVMSHDDSICQNRRGTEGDEYMDFDELELFLLSWVQVTIRQHSKALSGSPHKRNYAKESKRTCTLS
ncbi:6205_t:CDS:2 [Funneliformis mosseae]|uniref:6205_t:CDS:1 n=1 Tax=Funneliformis mosseae TaxID=27381 RepID=A0A9N8WCE4_FUNMO|nr:6205_t:CDS:2 [Funneliformis mosseae]